MYFHSLQFLAFLVVAFAAYWAVHKNKAARHKSRLSAKIKALAA